MQFSLCSFLLEFYHNLLAVIVVVIVVVLKAIKRINQSIRGNCNCFLRRRLIPLRIQLAGILLILNFKINRIMNENRLLFSRCAFVFAVAVAVSASSPSAYRVRCDS